MAVVLDLRPRKFALWSCDGAVLPGSGVPFFKSYKRAGSVVYGNCQLDPEEPDAGTSGVLYVGMHRFFCWKSPILVGNPGLFSYMNPANMYSIRTKK